MSAPSSIGLKKWELSKDGVVVGVVDGLPEIVDGYVDFPEILVEGDLSGTLNYNGHRLEIESVDEIIGLEVGPFGTRGPVWRRVRCRVVT